MGLAALGTSLSSCGKLTVLLTHDSMRQAELVSRQLLGTR